MTDQDVPVMAMAIEEGDVIVALVEANEVVIGHPAVVGWRWDTPGRMCIVIEGDSYVAPYVLFIRDGVFTTYMGELSELELSMAKAKVFAALTTILDAITKAEAQRKAQQN